MSNEKLKILVTGANGFIGKNLVAELKNRKVYEVLQYDVENYPGDFADYTGKCDLVFHLAGINRPQNENEFIEGNLDFTQFLTENLKKSNNKAPVVFSSSTQALIDNPYGKSKRAAEDHLISYSQQTGVPVLIYRLPNVFGKWCRPSYNSVVATFCHNIANGLPITINDPESKLTLIYIDDVLTEFLRIAETSIPLSGCRLIEDLSPAHSITLFQLSSLLESFHKTRENKSVPDLSDPLTRKLYATYLSYLPKDEFSYPLKMNIDQRGSFTEFIKTPDRGQVSVNISKPCIVKGNHWHHTKNEKFLVVSGNGIIRFRKVGTSEITEYKVSGDKLEVVDIPTGYTHNIENIGEDDMVTVMWASEAFDEERPDTIFENV
jgi:UDP-2-acetamido-2,6-beta-L-arabino-hexul-4-ose reductase